MTDKDTQLLEAFFESARQQQMADNGFTQRVMEQVPQATHRHYVRLSHLWTLFCIAVAAGFFFYFQGWQTLAADLSAYVITIPISWNPVYILAILILLNWIGVAEAVRRARLLN